MEKPFESKVGKRLKPYKIYSDKIIAYCEKNIPVLECDIGVETEKNSPVWVTIESNTHPESTLYDLGEIEAVYPYKQKTITKGKNKGKKELDFIWGSQIEVRMVADDKKKLLLARHPGKKKLMIDVRNHGEKKKLRAIKELDRISSKNSDKSPLLDLFKDGKEVKWSDMNTAYIPKWFFLKSKDDKSEVKSSWNKQREFVYKAMGTPDFAFLEGPPGSGKTTVLCELIQQMILQGKNVMMCASTHVAVDNIVEKLTDMANVEEQKDLLIMRIGKKKKIMKAVEPWLDDNISDTIQKEINSHLKNSKTESGKLFKKILKTPKVNTMIHEDICKNANVLCGTAIGIKYYLNQTKRKFDMLIIDEASKTTFQEFLVPALDAKHWVIVGDIKQLAPYTDEAEVAENVESIISSDYDRPCLDVFRIFKGKDEVIISVLDDDNDKLKGAYEKQCKKIGVELRIATGGTATYTPGIVIGTVESFSNIQKSPEKTRISNPDKFEQILKERDETIDAESGEEQHHLQNLKKWKNWKKSKSGLDTTWSKEIAWRLRRIYEIHTINSDKHDEAKKYYDDIERLVPDSTITDSDRILGGIKNIQKIAFPSILEIMQRGSWTAESESCSVMEIGMPREDFEKRHVLLDDQYRMHPEIANFASKEMYEGKALRTPKSVNRDWKYKRYTKRLEWINVNGRFGGGKNESEAEIVIRELKKFCVNTPARPRPDGKRWKVAILTFYKNQESAIRTKLRDFTGNKKARRTFYYEEKIIIELCTVDSFQGHEADLVFLSLANSRTTTFLNNLNRINVAITRARYQCIIIGNRRKMLEADHPMNVLARETFVKEYYKIHYIKNGPKYNQKIVDIDYMKKAMYKRAEEIKSMYSKTEAG